MSTENSERVRIVGNFIMSDRGLIRRPRTWMQMIVRFARLDLSWSVPYRNFNAESNQLSYLIYINTGIQFEFANQSSASMFWREVTKIQLSDPTVNYFADRINCPTIEEGVDLRTLESISIDRQGVNHAILVRHAGMEKPDVTIICSQETDAKQRVIEAMETIESHHHTYLRPS